MSKKYSGFEWTAWFHGGFQPSLIAMDNHSNMVAVPDNVLILTYTAIGTSLVGRRAVAFYNEITRVGRPSLRKFVSNEHQKAVSFQTFTGATSPNNLVHFTYHSIKRSLQKLRVEGLYTTIHCRQQAETMGIKWVCV